ncbi:UV DNA damage repair endonuclease UvsE [Salirhabdus sp. Marseille-P4669]|uniref:UV DNA damage repair endonuclease UvsE n=1 Tax=Salirhabdus sp. Marseille-P4669 TaxID=2042310 RepID=UPI000C799612|nr:UV DNA damage repair endonuclease UvsE [Salirhabdus sp. Marseille-P4669]
MTLFRLGYVAMSVHLQNSSPSQTMTFKRFNEIGDEEAAIHKLERIAKANLTNCLRLLKHNKAYDITFFRLSSKLIPLATHDALKGWNYREAVQQELRALGDYAKQNKMRLGFHPDHFVVLNTPEKEKLKFSLKTLQYHHNLLKGMDMTTAHRCVLHLGGKYEDKGQSLERFITNWAFVPNRLQNMIILENDDKIYTMNDILYVCEKLNVPHVFDLHHHMANYEEENWEKQWDRILGTWSHSEHPIKMHISSPKSESQFRAHADYIDPNMFLRFANTVKGSTPQIDCMIEAKEKDGALFQLVEELKKHPDVEMVDQASFYIKG